MFTVTVHNCSTHDALLQPGLRYLSLAVGEDSQPDSNLTLAENRKDVSDFCSTLCKWSNDSHLRDEQQLLHLSWVCQPQHSRCFLPGFFVDQHHVW
ncbi:hypothetical protein TNCV_1601741 [Trichonephila clavipes]|nr:hypothetical protein TNCV_1601741 [Trichonephila clavipes]